MTILPSTTATLSEEQLSLIRRFITAYNAIDRTLRSRVAANDDVPFAQVVKQYTTTHPNLRGIGDRLSEFGALRNALVHGEAREERYLLEAAR